ncbi:MAG: RNA polymerase sigma factor [Pirellulaceae bacterium]|nr:RNA polymerase sigma factor [Pirellulaceae bacterium]
MEQDQEVIGYGGEQTPRSDEELLLDYRDAGNREAFEELVHRYERELYNYLRQYLGDAQLAEDAFQTTFLQVHLKCETFEPTRRVRPWLFAVATNQAIDTQRKNKRHRMISLDRSFGGENQEDVGSLVDMLDGPVDDPLEQIGSAERDGMVRDCVDRLPKTLKEVILLVYYQGLKYREAAEALSIPVGTVKSRLHAAMSRLTAAVADTPLSNHE